MDCPRCSKLVLNVYGADRRLKDCLKYVNNHVKGHLTDDRERIRYLFHKLYPILAMMITVGNECKIPIDNSNFVLYSMADHIVHRTPIISEISDYSSEVIRIWDNIFVGDSQISMVIERLEKFIFIMSKGHPSWF